MNELEHLREWAFHGGGPHDDDAPMVYEEYLRVALPAIDALIAAAREVNAAYAHFTWPDEGHDQQEYGRVYRVDEMDIALWPVEDAIRALRAVLREFEGKQS